ncbi:hypothetical protein SAMN05192561_102360 [Halopenitus malekzadehii]|uniref:Uncharacterized protein n=1 Tax=Halopenitus malekzadehii TaxID=1267564 RepID=A0A1H6IL29_9EURY|nr:hypothetical protein SAMN05192561_102360 [Halopenitus malekzadehii]
MNLRRKWSPLGDVRDDRLHDREKTDAPTPASRPVASGWTAPIAATAFVWLLVSVACLPVLAAGSIRAAIDDWPTDRYAVNYLLLVGMVVLGNVAVFLGGVVVRGGIGGIELIRWTLLVAVGYPTLVWIALAGILPAAGRWDPAVEGLDGRIVLAAAALWYAIVLSIAAAVTFFLLFVLYFPG